MITVEKKLQFVVSMDEATAKALKTLAHYLTSFGEIPEKHQDVVKTAVNDLFEALDDANVHAYTDIPTL